ncbi:OPT domain-containing protein [Cephalotus follicularis]|uniref:OPT domain-containing protein n=1 Tax=Cephalotus follicularis TaxID=3775 RepID=A0A1Q3AW34_CEPFO|nr:OPT domain-containing protein [Cephalotus follicularis]
MQMGNHDNVLSPLGRVNNIRPLYISERTKRERERERERGRYSKTRSAKYTLAMEESNNEVNRDDSFRRIPDQDLVDPEKNKGRRDVDGDKVVDGNKGVEEASIEKIFASKEVPSWQNQLTFRAFFVSFVLGVLFSFIVMKLNLTTGIIPSLNVSAALLGFFFIKTWTKFLNKAGLLKQPFTRQENTVIQTCVVASSGIAFSGGFGSYLFGMSKSVADQSTEANDAQNIKNPELGWMIGFLFVVSFLGLFSVVPLRKIMIIDFKLTYPSGTATAHLINSFHTPQGAKLAKKQVRALGRFFSFSFLWGFFQWFFTGGDDCGFVNFPTFGLKAYENRFFFDFSATYVGVGMICPYLINISMLVGAVLSWGIMWPLIDARKGDWFPADLSPSSLHGLQGYRVFIAIAMILGDGLYNFFKVLGRTLFGLYHQVFKKDSHTILPVGNSSSHVNPPSLSYDDHRRTHLFLKDQIPKWFAFAGYITIAIISAATVPHIFHQLKWYYIVVIYIIAPTLAFCNAYGCGLTDWSLASTYGKLAIFTIGGWAGANHGGVLAGLAACGVMMNIVSTASDLMQDFKTGYLTLASPRSMFVSQIIGTAMGCVISPCVFWLFYKAFHDLGVPGSEYPAPYALVYRNMAILGVEGFSALPKNCLTLCYIFFIAAIVINAIRDGVGTKRASFIPIPMAMAIPFYLGSYFAIDMCVGSLILFVWQKYNKAKADAFGPAVASGLICGDGIWTLPSSILALAGVNPPICMKFLSRVTNAKVDAFLNP